MADLPKLPQFEIAGPFWTAEADLFHLKVPTSAWALRELFVEIAPRDATGGKVLLPGTLLVLAFVRTVRIQPTTSADPSYGFRRRPDDKPPAETIGIAELRQCVLDGRLALLLVQADPSQWDSHDLERLGTVCCLAGHVSLDVLAPESATTTSSLYGALDLEQPGAVPDRPGAALVPTLSVHASGVTLLGKARLPWQDARITAPFQLARILPDPALPGGERQPGYRLTIEADRLTAGEQAEISRAWARLAASVDAANPANAAAGTGAPGPRWATLSVANPKSIPRMYWQAHPWHTGTPLHIERGELALLLADQSPYDRHQPATTLARTVLDDVIISRTSTGAAAEVTLRVRAQRGGVTQPLPGSLTYTAASGAGGWDERYTLTGVDTAFDPVETPRLIREALASPAPSWAPGPQAQPVSPPVLWAFTPLEDGWAQLPILNLTAQMYMDAQLARAPVVAQALLAGAVAYGNDDPDVLAQLPREQPWTLTLLDADGIDGTWTLRQAGPAAPLVLASVSLTLQGPEVVIDGLLWLATGRPTPEDALPTLDDWITGLQPVALRTIDPDIDVLRPLAEVMVASLAFALRSSTQQPSAQLDAWSTVLGVDARWFKAMVDARLLPDDAFGRNRPLVWRRHATLPMVQALPMTQSRSPAVFPSASRQLAPFELPVATDPETHLTVPSGWVIGRTGGGAAESWPRALGAMAPAREWVALWDLPLASLSLPGLVLDPRFADRTGLPADAATGLPQQWRHDLPYADEAHALAQLPKIPPATSAPATPPGPPPPLSREALADHWRQLSERASLAALDAVEATATASGQAQVRGVVEPLVWPVVATVKADSYPGWISFEDLATRKRVTLPDADHDALQGLTAAFDDGATPGTLCLNAPPAPGTYPVVAGAMAAVRAADGSFRDQRGLLRGATVASPPAPAAARILCTPVRLADAGAPAYLLTTLLAAVPLELSGAAPWQLWFRDLPVAGGVFQRRATCSPSAEDVNDPEAVSRLFDHLNGFEWRLAPGRYALFGLEFYPLTLEAVTLAGDEVVHVELIGRLQLPVAGVGELADLANAVRLAFDRRDGRLVLTGVKAESAYCEWPLAATGGASDDAARIEWTRIALTAAGDGVTIDGAALMFQLFGAVWRVPLEALAFTGSAATVSAQCFAVDALASEPMPPREIHLVLDAAKGQHTVTATIGLRTGRGIAAMPGGPRAKPLTWRASGALPALVPAGARTAFAAEIQYTVLGSAPTTWTTGLLFGDVELERTDPGSGPTLLATDGALQFRWRTYRSARPSLQLLAGMHLDPADAVEKPGFATAAFRAVTADGDVPTLHLSSSFVEAVIRCRWGEPLQDLPGAGTAPSMRRVFGSSAGDVTFGFTGQSRETVWDEQYLLNGFLEAKDLVSWPTRATFDPAKIQLTLPAARPAAPLDHLRHTIRVLFDQHTIPAGTLEPGPEDTLFQLAAGKGWQLLAVVEHQLVDVTFSAASTLGVGVDRRWVAVQEVQIVSPASFKAWLLAFESGAIALQTPTGKQGPGTDQGFGIDLIGNAAQSELGAGLRAQLAKGLVPALDALAVKPRALLVEASAVHWVKELPVTSPPATPLQYLPGGTQLAALSRPEDYGPTDPRDPAWLLLQVPFLGRLQDEARDAVESSADGPLLAIDPVLNIQRLRAKAAAIPPLVLALSSWAETAPAQAVFSAFDAAVGRTFARLDPRALEESWFYLQLAAPEPPGAVLPSVLASFPSTPARLGRPAALALLYSAQRSDYPPQNGGGASSADSTLDRPVWRPSSLFVLQAVSTLSPSDAPPYGWLPTALQLLTGLVPRTQGRTGLQRFVAATQIPIAPASAPVPAATAVSPYLTLEFTPAPSTTTLQLSVAELVCLDAVSGRLQPVSTHVFEATETALEPEVRAAAGLWARETRARLAPESPIAVLRFRDIRAQAAQDGGAGDPPQALLVTRFGFALVPAATGAGAITRRVARLRSQPAELRFRDGRFGGGELPASMHSFELAPPQVNGVQPLYLTKRPEAKPDRPPPEPPATPPPTPRWPWGFAGLRTSIQYTAGAAGVAGRISTGGDIALWWQSLRHAVSYRSALSGAPSAGLPPGFRAPAIRSLLPVLPDPPLPMIDPATTLGAGGPESARRQPVLPGGLQATLVGARPGAFHSMRHQLVRQGGLSATQPSRGKALVSGSVPVRHRTPRPILLPQNDPEREDVALQPWASAFEPTVPLLVRSAPADEAFLVASGPELAHRLQIKIVSPTHGQIDPGWDGTIVADLAVEPPTEGWALPTIADWSVDLAIQHRGRSIAYAAGELLKDAAGELLKNATGSRTFSVQLAAPLRELLHDMRPGEVLTVNALVGRVSEKQAAGFRQLLSFPLRLGDPQAVRLPLEPVYVLFEDPEYNRLLASATKHATALIKTARAGATELTAVTLATDRTTYDPQAQIALRYDWTGSASGPTPKLSIDLLDATAVIRPLYLDVGGGLARELDLAPATLTQLSLSALRDRGQPVTLAGGQSLVLKLAFAEGQVGDGPRIVEPATIYLPVDISSEPVIPAPQAAYALLRWQTIDGVTQVDCPRFAWGPQATRVELVCPDDLCHEIVRRRAVFLWTDTARTGAVAGYAIQKITRTGSTYFPAPTAIEATSA
jgi:hypothetical protein